MGKIVILTMISVLMVSCGSKEKPKAMTVVNESEAVRIDAVCDCEELINHEGVMQLDGVDYTGVCESWVEKDSAWGYKFEEIQYLDGVKHGKAKVFDQEGNLLEESLFRKGVKASKTLDSCPCDELTDKFASDKIRYYYRMNDLYTGRCYSKYPHIDQVMQVKNFEGGLLVNDSIFDQEGGLLTVSFYQEGKLIVE